MKPDPARLINVQMTAADAEALIEVLNFSSQAATMLAQKELENGFGANNALRFNRMARDAKEFVTILTDHVAIGEPDDGGVH